MSSVASFSNPIASYDDGMVFVPAASRGRLAVHSEREPSSARNVFQAGIE
jgi:hypothetical protein